MMGLADSTLSVTSLRRTYLARDSRRSFFACSTVAGVDDLEAGNSRSVSCYYMVGSIAGVYLHGL
jgi:hypothetical protein